MIGSANYYYCYTVKFLVDKGKNNDEYEKEEKSYNKLVNFIREGDFENLINSSELKEFGINYRFGFEKCLLLGAAYASNQAQMVENLIKHGADDTLYNGAEEFPMQKAPSDYTDSCSRVVNEIAQRYFQEAKEGKKDPHLLFEIISSFIQEKNWNYCDRPPYCHSPPYRDGKQLTSLGNPNLSYNVNCADLTNLFIKAGNKIGLAPKEVKYRHYKSIKRENLKDTQVQGKFELFDEKMDSKFPDQFIFYRHFVAYVLGWHFDLTLTCKYQDKNSVLEA
jgi:hypothetical protein